ncbi:uncharacterized protein PgNI_02958, partial [Pyricularia grisea]|uniref:Uncharacterized protein n=1 Tax=Pyricularia grisea TaxID=148305 RepID=A0A6P8BE15_PYRGI
RGHYEPGIPHLPKTGFPRCACGIGRIGKPQLTIEYAYRVNDTTRENSPIRLVRAVTSQRRKRPVAPHLWIMRTTPQLPCLPQSSSGFTPNNHQERNNRSEADKWLQKALLKSIL